MAQIKAYEHTVHVQALDKYEISNISYCEPVLFTVWPGLVTRNEMLIDIDWPFRGLWAGV
jgi:hypothetical protein